MPMQTVRTTAIEGQKPGTSGLRKKTAVFRLPHFLLVSVIDLQIQDEYSLLIGYRNLMGIERVKV
ncbi:hypothetical protein N8146_03520 [Ascidiaceihabitans sp.]|nr:hypothetical protein [Ascidiaceihabitans sp.]